MIKQKCQAIWAYEKAITNYTTESFAEWKRQQTSTKQATSIWRNHNKQAAPRKHNWQSLPPPQKKKKRQNTQRPDGWGVCGTFQNTRYRIRVSNLEYSNCNMKQFAIRHCRTLQPTHTQKEKLEGLWHEPHEWEREDTCGWGRRRCFYKQLTGQCVQRKIRQFLYWTYIGKYDLIPQMVFPEELYPKGQDPMIVELFISRLHLYFMVHKTTHILWLPTSLFNSKY